jgi:hypothetical protein
MTDTPAHDDGGRLVACRSCGNRVARVARRCPACGAPEPTRTRAPAPRVSSRRPVGGSRWRSFGALAGAALFGAAASGAFFVLRPAPPAPVLEPSPAAPVAPEPRPVPAGAPAPPPEPSRSRGRTDWLFFFKTGDHLARMSDGASLGMVLRTVPRHTFADGTEGPAYLLQLPDGGGQRFVDADEVERGGRLQ